MGRLFRILLLLSGLLVFSATLGRTAQFRFAWLSDTHIGSPNAAADFEAAVQDINGTPDIAFVILSGDITEMGSDAEFEQAKGILDRLEKPFYMIPGNHDTKWSESGCTSFRRLFKDDRFDFEYGGYRFIGLHQGPIMKMGDGHFAPEDLRWFDSALSKSANSDQPLIFVTHYPLDSGIDNWYEAINRLKRHNTQAVLVGHGHQNRAMDFEALPGIMGRSNLRADAPAGGYTIVAMQSDVMRFSQKVPGAAAGTEWQTLGLGRRQYANDTHTGPRPDFSINRSNSGVNVLWQVSTGYTIASTPAVMKDRLVVGDASGVLYCLSLKNGKEHWRFRSGSSIYGSPDIADGKVVFGSTDTNIYCLDLKSGTKLWKVATNAAVVGGAAIVGGVVYIGGSDRAFRAIQLATGNVQWEFKGLNGFVETKPLVDQGRVIFGAWDTFLYALHTADGSPAWKWSNGNRSILYSPAACWPVAAGGKVFIAAPDRYLTALDAVTGTAVWRTNQFAVRETVGISQDGTRVYARCTTDDVVAVSASGIQPEVIWNANCGYGYDIDPSMPVEKDGMVFFGTKNGMVYALEGRSGTVRWKYRIGVTVVNTPVPISAKQVLVTDLDGRIILIAAR
jgi:outer membrane protein assembly factor BamB/Icc-related predicted phosphoesterase